jgi:hypothetical protein
MLPGARSMLRLYSFQGNNASCRTLSLQAGLHPAEVWLAGYGGASSRTGASPFSLLLLEPAARCRIFCSARCWTCSELTSLGTARARP